MSRNEAVRCVVTGQNEKSESVVLADQHVEPVVNAAAGQALWMLGGRDDVTKLPYGAEDSFERTLFPSTPSGYRAYIVEWPARGGPLPDAHGEWPQRGVPHYFEPDDPGMHSTDTVDVAVVIRGEIGMGLEGGVVETVVRTGDVVVQNGARHKWIPRDEACRILFVTLHADRGAPAGE